MKARVECLPRLTFLGEQLHMLELVGGFTNAEKEESVIVSFRGVGVELSVEEALEWGLSAEDLRAAAREPQEFEVKLLRIPERKEAKLCGDKNSRSACSA